MAGINQFRPQTPNAHRATMRVPPDARGGFCAYGRTNGLEGRRRDQREGVSWELLAGLDGSLRGRLCRE